MEHARLERRGERRELGERRRVEARVLAQKIDPRANVREPRPGRIIIGVVVGDVRRRAGVAAALDDGRGGVRLRGEHDVAPRARGVSPRRDLANDRKRRVLVQAAETLGARLVEEVHGKVRERGRHGAPRADDGGAPPPTARARGGRRGAERDDARGGVGREARGASARGR